MLLEALSSIRNSEPHRARAIDALTAKLVHAAPYPDITVGVHGGQVQWVLGNPFPIRVLDYDNDYGDAPDVDEDGQPCRCSIEPTDRRQVGARQVR